MTESPTKKCSKCGEHKPLDAFSKRKDRGDNGRVSRCKQCVSKKNASKTEAERKEAARRTAEWRKNNPEKAKTSARKTYMRTRHGISLAEFEKRKAAQDGCCASCGTRTDALEAMMKHLLCRGCSEIITASAGEAFPLVAAANFLRKLEHGT